MFGGLQRWFCLVSLVFGEIPVQTAALVRADAADICARAKGPDQLNAQCHNLKAVTSCPSTGQPLQEQRYYPIATRGGRGALMEHGY